jgi:hypothetical protein
MNLLNCLSTQRSGFSARAELQIRIRTWQRPDIKLLRAFPPELLLKIMAEPARFEKTRELLLEGSLHA